VPPAQGETRTENQPDSETEVGFNRACVLIKMRTLLTILGIVLVIAGIVFIGQGSGYFPYPAESFMISQTRWVYYGAAIAVAGALILIFALRR
jgi:hypothetical protein